MFHDFFVVYCLFFFKINFFEKFFQKCVGPNLGPNCLPRLLADDTGRQRVKVQGHGPFPYAHYGLLFAPLTASSCKIEPRCEKTGLCGFRPGPTQTGLCNHRTWLEA